MKNLSKSSCLLLGLLIATWFADVAVAQPGGQGGGQDGTVSGEVEWLELTQTQMFGLEFSMHSYADNKTDDVQVIRRGVWVVFRRTPDDLWRPFKSVVSDPDELPPHTSRDYNDDPIRIPLRRGELRVGEYAVMGSIASEVKGSETIVELDRWTFEFYVQ